MAQHVHHLVVYPGSFDPITLGHLDVVRRGRQLFDEVVVGVGFHPGKSQLFTPDERVEIARVCVGEMCSQDDGAPVRVCAYRGLTVDFARSVHANAILKGVRNLSDLQSEVQQALTNRQVAGLETAFVVSGQSFAYTSSSLIKQITALGEDLNVLGAMVPGCVLDRLRAKKAEHHPLLEAIRASARGEEQD